MVRILIFTLPIAIAATAIAKPPYAWLQASAWGSLRQRVAAPKGFQRVPAAAGSFAAWLRELPVKKGQPQVMLFDGHAKKNQTAHQLVIDIDVGRRDLQQCADAVMRLRAEYLFADISALTQLNRGVQVLESILRAQHLHPRLVNASDYPIPALRILYSTTVLRASGLIDGEDAGLIDELEVGLVDECGGLEGVFGAFAAEL